MPDESQEAPIGASGENPFLNSSEEPQAPFFTESAGDAADTHLLPFQVVGIGASAGGLEAYLELLRSLSPETGMAFVFVSHLSGEHKSQLVPILSRHTTMPVTEIADGMRCEPNHVYVLPPNARVRIDQGRLKLEPRPARERIPRPIDDFFRSLAADQKNHAVGVVLSGADSDGALGLKAIKGEGGIAMVQSPESARFPDMPLSGIAEDHVDLVLPPGRIGIELAHLAEQFARPELKPLEEGSIPQDDEQQFARILAILRSVSGIDFRNYKPTTLRRRLARRMMLKHVDSMPEYIRHMQARPEEARELQEDVLINVTSFFRDPDVFEALKSELFPRILEVDSPDQPIRIWSAGCSTGEETYSLAISLLESMASLPIEPAIQIFGTDASEQSIEKARAGIYPVMIANEVSPE
ncbi:MAG: chemotaxis protein CheB, partial [Bryobacteraceae bacterium]